MNHQGWKIGIVGVTGAVGRTMARCLSEVELPAREVRGFARPRSAGAIVSCPAAAGGVVTVEPLARERLFDLDLVLLSAGAEVSRSWVPEIAARGIWAIDNSSAFRMDPAVPLIVPEVNGATLPSSRGAIANPNCSTIQMVLALAPLERAFGLRRVHVVTFQSVSGRGQKGIDALRAERSGAAPGNDAFPHPIDANVIPQCDRFLEDGFTKEEEKMIRETRRILALPELPIHPTCARVPVEVSHSEAVHVTLARPAGAEEVRACLAAAPGLRVLDEPASGLYPTPRAAAGTNDVWVGRIRRDRSDPTVVEMWVVADNLRKGAAWNAVQIARLAHEREGAHARL